MILLIVLVAVFQGCFGATIRQTECPLICTMNYAPVCGSDGVTYPNECALNVADCLDTTQTITKVSDTSCSTTVKRQLTSCPAVMCPMVYAPVCGSDGKTYSNACVFHGQYCNNEETIVHTGSCDGDLIVS